MKNIILIWWCLSQKLVRIVSKADIFVYIWFLELPGAPRRVRVTKKTPTTLTIVWEVSFYFVLNTLRQKSLMVFPLVKSAWC